MNIYYDGTPVQLTGLVWRSSDPVNPQPTLVDPTAISLKYAISPVLGGTLGPTTTITYTNAVTPAAGVLARLSLGTFEVWLDTTGQPGYWTYEWVSTGIGQYTSPPGQFLVLARTLS